MAHANSTVKVLCCFRIRRLILTEGNKERLSGGGSPVP